MTLDDIIAEITARLGDPQSAFQGRVVGDSTVDGWIWVKDRTPHGMRIERIWDRHVVRTWRHNVPNTRRAELLRQGPLTPAEIRTVAVLGGLLPDPADKHLLQTDPWGWTIEHPASCTSVTACPVHRVALQELGTEQARESFVGVSDRIEVALNDFRDRLQILDKVDGALNNPDRSAGADWVKSGSRS